MLALSGRITPILLHLPDPKLGFYYGLFKVNIQCFQLLAYLVSFKPLNSARYSSPRKFPFVNVSPCGTHHGLISTRGRKMFSSLMMDSLSLIAELGITLAFGFIINWAQATVPLVKLVFEHNQFQLSIICHSGCSPKVSRGKAGLAGAFRWHQRSSRAFWTEGSAALHNKPRMVTLWTEAPSQGKLQDLALQVPHQEEKPSTGGHTCRLKLGNFFLESKAPRQGTEESFQGSVLTRAKGWDKRCCACYTDHKTKQTKRLEGKLFPVVWSRKMVEAEFFITQARFSWLHPFWSFKKPEGVFVSVNELGQVLTLEVD